LSISYLDVIAVDISLSDSNCITPTVNFCLSGGCLLLSATNDNLNANQFFWLREPPLNIEQLMDFESKIQNAPELNQQTTYISSEIIAIWLQ